MKRLYSGSAKKYHKAPRKWSADDWAAKLEVDKDRRLRKGEPGPKGLEKIEVEGRFTFNSVSALRNLVEDGQSTHLGPIWAFQEWLQAGRLLALLPDYKLEAYPLHALYSPGGYVPAKVRRFIDMLAERTRKEVGGAIWD